MSQGINHTTCVSLLDKILLTHQAHRTGFLNFRQDMPKNTKRKWRLWQSTSKLSGKHTLNKRLNSKLFRKPKKATPRRIKGRKKKSIAKILMSALGMVNETIKPRLTKNTLESMETSQSTSSGERISIPSCSFDTFQQLFESLSLENPYAHYFHNQNNIPHLRGSFHQASSRFMYSLGAGNQCTGIAAFSIALGAVVAPSRWSSVTMDNILQDGNDFSQLRTYRP